MTKHRALLIIDNLETIDDDQLIEFLRELPEPTKAIITTRHQISGTDQVHLLGLSEENSYTLMETESSLRGITISEEKMEMLYQRTGGVPLAIVWTIAKMKYYKTDDVISLHTDDAQYISHYCFYEVVENIIERPSYHTLLALSLFSNKATREALGHVTGFPPPLRDATLEELQKLSLINKTSHHFWMLPLTRDFVTEQLNLPENSELKEKLKHQFADYYNHLKIRKANETKEFIRSIHFALDLHSINIWQTDIHDYWQANKKALARGVKISRIFFMSKSIVYNNGQLNSLVIDVLNMQYDSGVSVKILWKEELDRQNIFHSTGQEIFHPLDLIIFDNTEAHIHKGSGGWYTDVVILDDSKSIEHWQKKYNLIEKYCVDWKDCLNTKNS